MNLPDAVADLRDDRNGLHIFLTVFGEMSNKCLQQRGGNKVIRRRKSDKKKCLRKT